MIVRFDTWERAGIFAGRMRAEGRHAVLLDGGACFLWGPLATGGVRVAVSDIVLDEDAEWPAEEATESELADVLRRLVVTFALAGPFFPLVTKAVESGRNLERRAVDPMELLATLAAVAGCAGAFALAGTMMPAFTRFLRDDSRLASWLVRLLLVLLSVALLL